MIKRSIELIKNGITAEVLSGCIYEHRRALARYQKLDDYYVGKHKILSRKKSGDGVPNNRIVANFPKYITDTAIGYMFGNPVAYQSERPLDSLNEIFSRLDINTHDAELGKDLSVFGVGFELVYMSADEKPEPKITLLDPREAFVVYNNTVSEESLFGVYYHKDYGANGKSDGYTIYAYTADEIFVFKAKKLSGAPDDKPVLLEKRPHYFGAVPLVQYWNNEEGMGDFEHVISEIDAYNTLQSDRVNDKERFVSAIFVVEGGTLGDDEDDADNTARKIMENGILELPDGGKVYYLTKALDESQTDVLRKSLSDDIHKFAHMPDFSDENFSGNASGVAMQYKLTNLENLAKVKQGFFAAGLRERLKLFAKILYVQGKQYIDPARIKINFNRTLPVNELETAQTVSIYAASGTVSKETLLERISFVSDKDAEREKIKKERAEQDAAAAKLFGGAENTDDIRL